MTCKVTLQPSGRSFLVARDEPVLAAAIRAKDVPAQVLDVAPAAAPSWPADAARIEALLPMRLAEPFE